MLGHEVRWRLEVLVESTPLSYTHVTNFSRAPDLAGTDARGVLRGDG